MRLCAINHALSNAHAYANAIFTRYCDTHGMTEQPYEKHSHYPPSIAVSRLRGSRTKLQIVHIIASPFEHLRGTCIRIKSSFE